MNSSQIGGLSSLLSLIFALFYSLGQVAALFQLIPAPLDLFVMFVPGLLLAPCFLVVMASLFHRSSKHSRLLSLLGLCFALVYCGLVPLVYFGQLAAILPLQLKRETVNPQLAFEGSSLMGSIACLGYTFMSLATLCVSLAYSERRGLSRSMLAHGLLAPVIVAAFFFPMLQAASALWMLTFPWAMIQSLRFFRTGVKVSADESNVAVAP